MEGIRFKVQRLRFTSQLGRVADAVVSHRRGFVDHPITGELRCELQQRATDRSSAVIR
jgi:hypothetical protein